MHALEVDAGDLSVPGEDRLQAGRAHLDRLLHHVVEARVLERCEQIMQVERGGLGPGARADGEREPAFSGARERAPPFAVAAVEYQHAIARFQPQHVGEVIGLRCVERDARALLDRRVEVKARDTDIAAGHGAVIVAVWLRTAVEKPESETPVNDAWSARPPTSGEGGLPLPVRGFAVLSPNSKGC